ncbi:DJ-1/PfpI family protein [Melioribacteraceae bacterium 4301-Me]|uniref:DJ-1/PfpI family protein n=1 Tax=Pyranulibacter aquaticus TaxID=3163344 RepID=UPI0035979002
MGIEFLTKKSILLILPAQDFNEQEYLIISSQLQRANIKIFIASDANTVCKGASSLKVKNDVSLYNIHESNFGGIIFIGGNGVKRYWTNKSLHNVARKFFAAKKIIGAICSAPIILAKAGLIKQKATCFVEDKNELEKEGIEYIDTPVYIDTNKIVTAQSPTNAAEFVSTFIHLLNN